MNTKSTSSFVKLLLVCSLLISMLLPLGNVNAQDLQVRINPNSGIEHEKKVISTGIDTSAILDTTSTGATPGSFFQWSPNSNQLLYANINSVNSGPGSSPYDLLIYDATLQKKILIASGGDLGRPKFSLDGSTISYWYNNIPYLYSFETMDSKPIVITTDQTLIKGAFSSDNKELLYVTAADQIIIKDIPSGSERFLSENKDIALFPRLSPEWSPDNQLVAITGKDNIYIINLNDSSKTISLSEIEFPQSEFSSISSLFEWSATDNSLSFNSKMIYPTSSDVPSPKSWSQNHFSFDNNFEIIFTNGEIYVNDHTLSTSVQLTTNQDFISKSLMPEAALSIDATTTSVANGFDYPVGKPDGNGYNTTAGCWWLQTTGACAPGPHPGQDFNGNGGGDSDLGDPVYAVANGVVTFSDIGSGTSWGNIILIEHLLPDGSRVWSQYAHLRDRYVSAGVAVNKGDLIGTIGKGYNNNTFYAHLHFEIRKTNLSASFWPSNWSIADVEANYTNPSEFINSHRNISSGVPLPTSATFCASEGGRCTFNGIATVYYGANNSYYYKDNISGGIDCNNANFGDPLSGSAKACYYIITTPLSSCPSITGEVRLYDLVNCGGDSVSSGVGLLNVVPTFNDRAESIAIPSGWSANVYVDNSELSANKCFTTTDTDFSNDTFSSGTIVANQATFVRVYDNSSCSGTDNAAFVSQSGYPTVSPGQTFQIYFQVQNSGSSSWQPGSYWLQNQQYPMGANSVQSLNQAVAPDGNYTWTINLTAPTTPGTYQSSWMVNHNGTNFGSFMFINVTVQSAIPATPSNFRVSGSTYNTITTTWDDVNNEDGYKIYKWQYQNGVWDFYYLTSVAANITSFTDTSLQCGAVGYFYQVTAYNASGESARTSWVQGTTDACPILLPAAFQKSNPAKAATGLSGSPTLSWSASSGATTYDYCYDTTNDNGCSNWISNGSATTKTLSGLSPNTTYYWQVRAVNASGATYGDGYYSNFYFFTTGASVAPGTFNKLTPAKGVTGLSGSPTLSWSTSSGATTYYYCYDTTNDNGCSTWISNGSSTTKNLSGLAPNTTYYWQVRAANSSGTTYANGYYSAFFSFTTSASVAPSSFNKLTPAKAATGISGSPTLSWSTSSGATTYYYCYDTTNDNGCSNWVSNGSSTTKTLSGLAPNTTYYWQVKAVNATGTSYANGYYSAFFSFTTSASVAPASFNKLTPAKAATGISGSPTLSWSASSGATTYYYCYDTTNDNGCSTWISNGSSATTTLSGLAPNTTYYWQVRAVNATGTTYANGYYSAFWAFLTSN